jgi:hypothetical protein
MDLPPRSFEVRMNDGSVLVVRMEMRMAEQKPTVPATKPADPAFERALRVQPMRIGLRYHGDGTAIASWL